MILNIEYDDVICCDDAEKVIENEVCDTHGGNYTYRTVYSCDTCKRAFADHNGGRFNGVQEIAYSEDKSDY